MKAALALVVSIFVIGHVYLAQIPVSQKTSSHRKSFIEPLVIEKQKHPPGKNVLLDTIYEDIELRECKEYLRPFKKMLSKVTLCNHLNILSTRVLPKTTRPTKCNGCNILTFPSLIQPKDVCAGSSPIDLLILVTTTPLEYSAREAIRNTWASYSKENSANVRHLFLFGGGWGKSKQNKINNESVRYGDILQDDYKDAYYNLSYKVISGYHWALKHCPRAQFVLRTSDDSYINIPQMLHWIKTWGSHNMRVQIGQVYRDIKPLRELNSKWAITYAEYPKETYPPFAIGTSFLYSMPAVREVVKAAPNVPFFPLEDIWFGLVMREINMTTKTVSGFIRTPPLSFFEAIEKCKCPLNGEFTAAHYIVPEAMTTLWRLCNSKTLSGRDF